MKSQSLTGAGRVHCCKQMRQRGPLGGRNVLAHVDNAVHCYVRVGLHQAAHKNNYSSERRGNILKKLVLYKSK